MSQTITTDQEQLTRQEAVDELRRLRAEFAEATGELSTDEYEDLVERVTRRVDDGLRERVRQGRGERA